MILKREDNECRQRRRGGALPTWPAALSVVQPAGQPGHSSAPATPPEKSTARAHRHLHRSSLSGSVPNSQNTQTTHPLRMDESGVVHSHNEYRLVLKRDKAPTRVTVWRSLGEHGAQWQKPDIKATCCLNTQGTHRHRGPTPAAQG